MLRWMGVGLMALALLVSTGGSADAQCGVFKTWALNEVLTSSDLNQAFNRTVSANTAACATGDSPSVGQMRVMVDPYPGSAESLATTVQGELERLRFQMQALVGKTYWYEVIDNSLAKDVSKHWGATFTSYAEMADPPPPGPNDLRLYAKDDGAGVTILAYKDSNGIVNALNGPSTSYGSSVTINFQIRRNPGTPNTKLDVTADRISVAGFIKAPLSLTIDATTTGANALDTGALANATLYYVWVIVNPTTNTFAGLVSNSETAPTMPTGYTRKRLLGAYRTDGSAHFIDGVQKGNEFTYTGASGSGFSFGVGGPSSVSFCSWIPQTTARAARFYLQDSNLAGGGIRSTLIHWQNFTASSTSITLTVNTPFARTYNAFETTAPARIPMLNAADTCHIFVQQFFDQVGIFVIGWEMEWRD